MALAVEQQVVLTLRAMNDRGNVSDEAAKVDPCDGTDTSGVKDFLRNLELVPDIYREAVVKRVARASLLRESLEWLTTHVFAYDDYRTHILRTFVSQDTDGVLRRELQKVTRQPGETILAFNRRFRETAANAYPGQHNAEQVESLVRLYAAALRDQGLAARIVSPAWPATLEEGLTRVADTERKSDNLVRLGVRTEEAMEIDAFTPRSAIPSAVPRAVTSATDKELHLLKTQYGKLEAKMDRVLEGLAAPRKADIEGPPRRSFKPNDRTPGRGAPFNRPPSHEMPGRETRSCFYCKMQGHIVRNCRKRQQDEAGQGGSRQIATASGRQ